MPAFYDPYIASSLDSGNHYVDSYWTADTSVASQAQASALPKQAEIVVVGAGYTGLSCAYELSQRYQRQVVLLEANQPGWGCSSRNAGFVLRGTGRLGLSQLKARFGLEQAQLFHQEYGLALQRLKDLVAAGNIDCQAQTPGYLKIAHTVKQAQLLQQQAERLQRDFAYAVSFLDQTALQACINSPGAFGALRLPDCYGINPFLLLRGLAGLAERSGVKLFANTSLQAINHTGAGYQLTTSAGSLHCDKLVLATNAYTPKNILPELNRGCLPVLSSIIVTRPLTASELSACGLTPGFMAMDTRALKYYYRLLPDNRVLFGGRSAISGADLTKPHYPAQLRKALWQTLPALQGIDYQYHWAGWVGVSYDDLPRIAQTSEGIYYAAGYCGSGVSYSLLAGQRLAEKLMGETLPPLALYQSPLQPFPFTRGRRLAQNAYYQWAQFSDRFLS
ncbi:FAD dependent oxidoreductase [Alishewanella aestuarii B11]|uniref:FAD dependent oxidoreductase n=1 Tax=Alishewanella aestuarii B11 TaxID=1197174 RepID=J2IE39_9ALTE|nr:FAD-binding oxidoreductase [Alishewanella aestuarii]EJI85417.1 FAD dependent oxidoreductase [Alishewanella aestuarii B11]